MFECGRGGNEVKRVECVRVVADQVGRRWVRFDLAFDLGNNITGCYFILRGLGPKEVG